MTEVAGNDEDVVYDKLEANITIQVVRETVDNQVKLVAKVVYPEDIVFNNKLVTPAKAKIAFGKELTKAGVKQDLKQINSNLFSKTVLEKSLKLLVIQLMVRLLLVS